MAPSSDFSLLSLIHQQAAMLPLLFFSFLAFYFFYLSVVIFSHYSKERRRQRQEQEKVEAHQGIASSLSEEKESFVDTEKNNIENDKERENGSDPTRMGSSVLLEMLPTDSPKWEKLFVNGGCEKGGSDVAEDRVGDDEEEEKKKKRKKRAKKKRTDPNGGGGAGEQRKSNETKKEELMCLYPFTTSCSGTQRKIKQQYDQLVKFHQSHGLTVAQVGQFVNCLVDAKNELQHRSEVIQRKFTITKALLLKADRSSFDRLRQQIYKLELEQKRLEEDAFVYNWLQQQLKLSPAYKKILEISASMESKAKSGKQADIIDNEFADISFEELLAQEKKDAFWQRNGKTKSCSA